MDRAVLGRRAVPPSAAHGGEQDESGRGLAIVDALSAEWGCFATSLPHSGKVTWALIGAGWRDHPPV